jgi:hypothetical protein
MDNRKTRISKLSERFKGRTGRPKQTVKDRERRSYYLDVAIADRLDEAYKELNHTLYPRTVSKSAFIETILSYGLDRIPEVKKLIITEPEPPDLAR